MFKTNLFAHNVDESIHPRDAFDIGTFETGKAQGGALDRNGRVFLS